MQSIFFSGNRISQIGQKFLIDSLGIARFYERSLILGFFVSTGVSSWHRYVSLNWDTDMNHFENYGLAYGWMGNRAERQQDGAPFVRGVAGLILSQSGLPIEVAPYNFISQIIHLMDRFFAFSQTTASSSTVALVLGAVP